MELMQGDLKIEITELLNESLIGTGPFLLDPERSNIPCSPSGKLPSPSRDVHFIPLNCVSLSRIDRRGHREIRSETLDGGNPDRGRLRAMLGIARTR